MYQDYGNDLPSMREAWGKYLVICTGVVDMMVTTLRWSSGIAFQIQKPFPKMRSWSRVKDDVHHFLQQ